MNDAIQKQQQQKIAFSHHFHSTDTVDTKQNHFFEKNIQFHASQCEKDPIFMKHTYKMSIETKTMINILGDLPFSLQSTIYRNGLHTCIYNYQSTTTTTTTKCRERNEKRISPFSPWFFVLVLVLIENMCHTHRLHSNFHIFLTLRSITSPPPPPSPPQLPPKSISNSDYTYELNQKKFVNMNKKNVIPIYNLLCVRIWTERRKNKNL